MLSCTPFLLFDGNCAEAMKFYQSCLGGDLTITKLGDSPMRAYLPEDKHQRTINAHLKSGAVEFSATDWMAAPAYLPKPGNTFSIFVIGEAYEELEEVFNQLSKGAEKDNFQGLHDLPFGTYGQFTDRYGVRWIFKGDRRN